MSPSSGWTLFRLAKDLRHLDLRRYQHAVRMIICRGAFRAHGERYGVTQ